MTEKVQPSGKTDRKKFAYFRIQVLKFPDEDSNIFNAVFCYAKINTHVPRDYISNFIKLKFKANVLFSTVEHMQHTKDLILFKLRSQKVFLYIYPNTTIIFC